MAQWIWYPGDFEFYLGLDFMSSRTERGLVITPNWRMENFYNSVKFSRDFELEKDTYIKIYSTGTQCVMLDFDWYSHYDPEEGLFVKKGQHTLWVLVFSKVELPSIYIDCPGVETGEGWTTTCDNRNWKKAGYWNFTDVNSPPTRFRLETTPIWPVKETELECGTLYDFGQETMARVKGSGLSGQGTLTICYGESKEEALDTEECCVLERIKVEEGVDSFCVEKAQAFRYLYIPNSQDVSVNDIYADYEYLPVENQGRFQSEDALLNKIYEVSLHTLHLTTREFFLDGIKRDRWVWSGDATQSYLMNYYSFFDNEVCKRTMRFIRGKDPVVTHFNTIQDYTLYWFVSLGQYYLYTGDKKFMGEIYPSARKLMEEFCLPKTDERGFLMAQPGDWVFIDWADVPNMNVGDLSFIQLLFAHALKTLSEMAALMEDKASEARYVGLYKALMEKVFRVFWSDEKGCFTHGPADAPNAIITRYANMFAVILDCLDEKKKQSVIENVLLNDKIYAITTPYMKFYELMALCEAGRFEQTEEYMKAYWGGMLALGCTSFWEKYDPKNTGIEHYKMYGLKYGVSLCHAWGAGPILLFGKYYLGVRPTAPGYQKFVVEPHLIGGKKISGQVPTPSGVILVELTEEKVIIENHSEGIGELHIDNRVVPVPAGELTEVSRV